MFDVYILDEKFRNKTLVEGYSSFIWTDRAREEGEFTAVFPANAPILSSLEKRQFLGQNMSHKIMQILTKKFSNKDGSRICTISGLSYEHVFKTRTLIGTNPNTYSWSGAHNRAKSYEYDSNNVLLRTNMYGNPRFISKGVPKTGGYEPLCTTAQTANCNILVEDSGGCRMTPVATGNGDGYIQIGSTTSLDGSGYRIKFEKNSYVGIMADIKLDQEMVATHSRARSIYSYCAEGSSITELVSTPADNTADVWQTVSLISRVTSSATGYMIRLYNGSKNQEDVVTWDRVLIVFGTSEDSVRKSLIGGYFDGSSTFLSLHPTISFTDFTSSDILTTPYKYYSLKEFFRALYSDTTDILPYLTGAEIGTPDIEGYAGNVGFSSILDDTISVEPKDIYTMLTSASDYYNASFGVFRNNNGDNDTDGVKLYFYTGNNRSLNNSSYADPTYPAVVFSQELGTLTDIEEVLSVEEVFNVAEVHGKYQSKSVEEVTRTGYDRIVNIIDASSEIDTDKFDSATDFNLNRVGKAALAESFEEVILDGEHSKASGYVYEKDFGLGTRVSFIGDSGTRDMIVTEYIFSQDDTGFSCYPTLKEYEF